MDKITERQLNKWLGEDNTLGKDIWERKYRYGDETLEEWFDRVSGGDEELRQLIKERKFLFGGRTLANRGVPDSGNFFNCFEPSTKIITRNGIKTMQECLNKDIQVLSKNSWRDATVQEFGEQDVVTLHLRRGTTTKTFKVTKNHIWFAKTEKNRKSDKYDEYTTMQLEHGMRLRPSTLSAHGVYHPSPFGVAHGIFWGDGTKADHLINLCGEKMELATYFTPANVKKTDIGVRICGMPNFFSEPPKYNESASYIYGWLAGYFAADGCVDENGVCVLTSSKLSDLELAKDLFSILGIPTNDIRSQYRKSNLTDEYSHIYFLTIARNYLKEDFFIRTQHKQRFLANPPRDMQRYWTVDYIEDEGERCNVMCVVEPVTHAFTLDGNILTHNCFSLGFVPDDYSAIMDALKEVGVTFKSQGGQGISLSKLRPKGAPIGKHYKSDGIIPFIEMFNCVTQGTSQGGSRKGALMISLDARHKEAMDFINLKTDVDAITKANLSLEIDDEFMRAVEKYYTDGEIVTLHEKREYSGHIVEYDIIPINLYKRMMEIVWDYGEPGCIFADRFRNYNFLEYDDRYQIETCNP